mmetsp:Transcript_26643/g.68419  ORF Transcript_26643/g.68419 Transcript_26643/m.68419 type:complete len:215 (+) Transcript_26643:526-1170(+)
MPPRHSRAMIGRHHQNHLQKFAAVVGQSPLKPQQGDHTSNTDVLIKHLGDGHASIEQLFTAVIHNGGYKVGGLSDETQLLRPLIVHGNDGLGWLHHGLDHTCLQKFGVHSVDLVTEFVEVVGYANASLDHCFVFRICRLQLPLCKCTSMAELHLIREDLCACTDTPSNERLLDLSTLHRVDYSVLFISSHLPQEHHEFHLGVGLVAKKVVKECG